MTSARTMLVVAALCAVSACSGGGGKPSTNTRAACAKASVATLPPDASPAVLQKLLEQWWVSQPFKPSGIGLGNQVPGNPATPPAVLILLPPGCHNVGEALRTRYDDHVHVDENVVLRPVGLGGKA